MRVVRWAAFVAWAVVALLAIAGFAAFSPERAPTPSQASADTTTSVTIRSDWGSLAGRVAAMAFATGMRTAVTSTEPPPVAPEPAPEPTLPKTPTTSSTTTTTIQPVTTTQQATTIHTHATTTTTHVHATTTTTTHVDATTTTTPTTTRTFRATVDRWRPLVEQYFQAGDVNTALSVIECESGGNPDAVAASGLYHGLFQHSQRYWEERSTAAGWAGADVYDPEANIAVAAWLVYEGGGWRHWASCS
jgi:hypothetical protein